MDIKHLYNDNLRKLPNNYGDVSVMMFFLHHYIQRFFPKFIDKACKIIIPQNKKVCVYRHVGEAFNVSCVQFHHFLSNC